MKTVGENVELECVLYHVNASEYPVSWLKETEDPFNLYKLLSRGSHTIPDNRYAVAYIPIVGLEDAGLFRLQIRDLLESDSGTYLCNVHLSDTTRLEGKMTLTVESAAESEEGYPETGQQVDTNATQSGILIAPTVEPAAGNR